MGLKSLLTDLEGNNHDFGESFPFHNVPASNAGFNYGESISIFDHTTTNNDYFPFKQRSLGYGDGRNGTPGHGADVSMGVFGRTDNPEPFRKQKLPKLTDEMGSGVWDVVDGVTDSFIRGGLITATKRSVADAARRTQGADLPVRTAVQQALRVRVVAPAAPAEAAADVRGRGTGLRSGPTAAGWGQAGAGR